MEVRSVDLRSKTLILRKHRHTNKPWWTWIALSTLSDSYKCYQWLQTLSLHLYKNLPAPQDSVCLARAAPLFSRALLHNLIIFCTVIKFQMQRDLWCCRRTTHHAVHPHKSHTALLPCSTHDCVYVISVKRLSVACCHRTTWADAQCEQHMHKHSDS